MPQYLICKNEKSVLLWALTKVSRRNQVICSSFAFPGFVGTEQHSYDFQIQVMLAQRFSFHYRPGSGSDLFLPLLVAPRRCLLRTVVQMLHPCISFLHKHRDFAVLLQFHFFDAVFRNRPIPVYRRIFRIWLFCGRFAKSLASACSGVQHTWVIQLGGMVARVYDQSVDGVVLFEARLVALKLVKCCCPRENQGAVTYTATGVAFVVRTINLSGWNGNVLGFKIMRVIGVLE